MDEVSSPREEVCYANHSDFHIAGLNLQATFMAACSNSEL